jgi:monofunctional biosynthetic peptidoglycan transglycosylase
VKRLLVRAFLAALLGLLILAGYVWSGLPAREAVRRLARETPTETSLMRQRSREAERTGRKARREKAWVPLVRISRHLIHAVITAEDARFFGHEGVDWDAVQQSLEKDLEKRRFARGGSTITQQLAKNLYFGTRRTITRKLRELIVARWLESDLTKARILALYLNVIEWGDGVYGCEAAARRWYGKSSAALSASEAAGLAAMIPNPRRLNPQVNPPRHARATRRVLWLMALAGYLGRDAAGLGAAPPPAEPIAEDEEPEDEPPPQPAAEPGAPNVAPPSGETPADSAAPPAGEAGEAAPTPVPTPPPPGP